jgi:Ni-sirohydrochlorin a,c-diamide synthase
MMDQCPRVLLAGDRSSSGKTTIVAGLLSALRKRNLSVQPYKVAMDYIDPSYHTLITGRFCRNLDGYLMEEKAVKEVYANACKGADVAVIEGVRGLYEGYDGDLGSTAQIAKMLRAPVIFVVDARSITRSAAALVKGYADFDPEVQFRGVILNKIGSKRHEEKARKEIERYAGLEVVGAIPRDESMHLAMRHLGLVPVCEGRARHDGFNDRLERIRSLVEESLDIDRILEIASSAESLEEPEIDIYKRNEFGRGLKIGVALDEAFNFYYRENLELMELSGAQVVPFSPVQDKRLPDVDGVYIGGGYPEIYADELSKNSGMLDSLIRAKERGTPIFAECGGLMYLAREIEWEGRHDMAGLVPGKVRKSKTRVVSYVCGQTVCDCILGDKGSSVMGHEFHHSELVMDDGAEYAIKLERGTGIERGLDGFVDGNLLASYTHVHSASYRHFPSKFIAACSRSKETAK